MKTLLLALALVFSITTSLLAQPTFKPNEKVEVKWGETWYPSDILEKGEGKYKVRYHGPGDEFEDWISTDRIRKINGNSAPAPAPNLAPAPPPQQKQGAAAYNVGDKVEAWNVTWYKATIIEIGSGNYNGYFKVHYDDFGSASDQYLKASSIRPVQSAELVAAKNSTAGGPRSAKYIILSYGSVTNPLRLGFFTLSKGNYTYTDMGNHALGSGKYTYDAAGKKVNWLSGPFKANGWGGKFEVSREGKTHSIRLTSGTIGTNSTDSDF